MIEILGTELTENALMGDAIGAFIGAIIVSYMLYVVAFVIQKNKIIDEKMEAALAHEEYPAWRAQRVETWYRGYKLALIECLVLGFFLGAGAGVLAVHLGWVHGAIEVGALAGLAAIVAGFVIDVKIIHPIAKGKFMVDVEVPLVQKFLGIVKTAAEDAPEDLKEIAKKLRDKGLI